MTQTRRLAAILAADVAGYSRLMGADEEGMLERLKALRRELVDPKIGEHRGRIVKTTGDGLLVEFASVVDAVRCAVAVQQAMPERDMGAAADSRIELRIGINLGDVIVEGDDLYGDGVNIAARIESLADAGGVFVSNTVHDQVRDRLPFVFEDLGEQQVKNITRPVRVYRVRDASAAAKSEFAPALPLPDKPSIAVLPFANMSGDQEQEYFADGMVEEIITALSRIRWLFVIARNSSFTYKGQAVDVKRVGRELGVRYVLEGSVRKAGGRVRITSQLIDALNGTHLWADRFDGSLEDVFELQDHVAGIVAGVIEPALEAAEVERARRKAPDSFDAYDLYLRALSELHRFTTEGTTKALEFLRQAISRGATYPPTLAEAAFCYARRRNLGWITDEHPDIAEGIRLARAALSVARDDATALATAAFSLWLLTRDTEAAARSIERAVTLNPNSAVACGYSGVVQAYGGVAVVAIDRCTRAMRLSPLDHWTWLFLHGMAVAHLTERRLHEALACLQRAYEERPTGPYVLAYLVSTYAHLGRLSEARAMLPELTAVGPGTVAEWKRHFFDIFTNAPDEEFVCEGLRRAGLPEG
jgi:TolB-like protein